jgi:putative phage-type endonuclease
MLQCKRFDSKEKWLKFRNNSIGGSDVPSIFGLSPWKSVQELWMEKKGLLSPKDLSNNNLVQFGIKAEKLLRELFILENLDKYTLHYTDNNLFINDKYPFAHASLDGWLEDKDNKKAILEIKTATVTDSWERIPDYYQLQVIHYLMVTEFDYVILKARLRHEESDYVEVKHFKINRADVLDTIDQIASVEELFYKSLQMDEFPSKEFDNISINL